MSKLRVRLKTEGLLGGGLEAGGGMVREAKARGRPQNIVLQFSILGMLNRSRDRINIIIVVVYGFILVEDPKPRIINNSHAHAHEQRGLIVFME